MSMDVVPEFAVKKCIYKDVPFDVIRDPRKFDRLNYFHDYVSMFTGWEEEKFSSLWVGNRIEEKSGDF